MRGPCLAPLRWRVWVGLTLICIAKGRRHGRGRQGVAPTKNGTSCLAERPNLHRNRQIVEDEQSPRRTFAEDDAPCVIPLQFEMSGAIQALRVPKHVNGERSGKEDLRRQTEHAKAPHDKTSFNRRRQALRIESVWYDRVRIIGSSNTEHRQLTEDGAHGCPLVSKSRSGLSQS